MTALTPPICRRCRREAHGWPLPRPGGDTCSPKGWARCLREPEVVAAENAARSHPTKQER